MSTSKNVARVSKACVACGNCAMVCPKGAISIYKGTCAVLEAQTCIGCGVCATSCPAGLIQIALREGGGAGHA